MLRNTWNKEKTHRGALLCKKLSDIRSCSVCWWPKPAKLPLLRTYQAKLWETLHLPFYEPFCSSPRTRCCHPRWSFPLLEVHLCCHLILWFLIPPKAGTESRWLPSSMQVPLMCTGTVCCLHIPEQPRFFQPVLRRSHFEDEPAKLHRERDANKKTHQNTASISNTTSSSPSTQVFLGTEGSWDNSPADRYRTRAWEVHSEQHTSLKSTVIHSPHLFISGLLGSSLERKRKWPYNQVRSYGPCKGAGRSLQEL